MVMTDLLGKERNLAWEMLTGRVLDETATAIPEWMDWFLLMNPCSLP